MFRQGFFLSLSMLLLAAGVYADKTFVFAVEEPSTTLPRSWTHVIEESGDYQIGMAWLEVLSGNNVALEVVVNGTDRRYAAYAKQNAFITRFENRLEGLVEGDTITVRVDPNGGRYRIGYEIAFCTPTFEGLPVFNVSDFGAIGDGSTDDMAAIQSTVAAAVANGGGIIRLDGAATYRVVGLSDLTNEYLFDLANSQNIRIEGNGASIILHPPDSLFRIDEANNIEISGLSMDYQPKPYYQGTITQIDVGNMFIDINVPERYPVPEVGVPAHAPFFGRSFIPDSAGSRSGRGDNIYIESIATNGTTRDLRIHVPDLANGAPMQPRVQAALNGNATEFVVPHILYGHRGGASRLENSSRVKLVNLRWHVLPHFWMFIQHNTGPVTLSNVDLLMPDPSTELLASWRDGHHIKNSRWGILIEDGDWNGAAMYDDLFAIYSRRQVVVSNVDEVSVDLAPSVYSRESFLWKPGDWASFWTDNQGIIRGMARVVSVQDLESPNYRVTFESLPPGVKPTDVVLHEESLNRGTLIRNCSTTPEGSKMGTTRLRGTSMTFEQNHFDEFYFHLEWDDSLGTPRARDVAIRDTYISNRERNMDLARALRVIFSNCTFDDMKAVLGSNSKDMLFEGCSWINMDGNVVEAYSGSEGWIFGGSSRNGNASGLSGFVYADSISAITLSTPADYPPSVPPSGEVLMVPQAPSLTGFPGQGSVFLDWPVVADAASYTVYRGGFPGGPYSESWKSIPNFHVDAGLIPDKKYYYVVTATNSAGDESPYSNEVLVVPDGVHLAPVADTYVQGGASSGGEFGARPTLDCKTDPTNPDFTRESYLRFDLSSLDLFPTRSYLRLKVDTTTGPGDLHNTFFVELDTWGEYLVNWFSKPVTGALLGGEVSPEAGQWIDIDVSPKVGEEFSGDKLFSIALISEGLQKVSYHSRESPEADSRPQLVAVVGEASSPNPPEGLMAISYEGGEVWLGWKPSAEDDVVKYAVYRSISPSGPFEHLMNTDSTSFLDRDLLPGETAYYRVVALSAAGTSSLPGTTTGITFVSDYGLWISEFPEANLGDPFADYDKDGLSNNEERIWGLDPADGASCNPILSIVQGNPPYFIYTRRNPSLTGLTYSIYSSTDLGFADPWTQDLQAVQEILPTHGDVERVSVGFPHEPTPELPIFFRVHAH